MTATLPGAETRQLVGPRHDVIRGIAAGCERTEVIAWHTNRVVWLTPFGAAHAIGHFWNDASDVFLGYYINLQAPLRRSPHGFDSLDHVLDIVVDPDGTWHWTDEDEFDEAVALGLAKSSRSSRCTWWTATLPRCASWCGTSRSLTREITRRRNQLQQSAAATFPEFKTFFRGSTASFAARALLARLPTPQALAEAQTDQIADVLRSANAYKHAKRATELQELARSSAGAVMLSHHQWRQGWIIRQLDGLEAARAELLDQVRQLLASHPYTPIIESLPIKSPIWTATLIAAIGDMRRFNDHREFKRYLGWTPEVAKSGSSTDQSNSPAAGCVSLEGHSARWR